MTGDVLAADLGLSMLLGLGVAGGLLLGAILTLLRLR